VVLRLWRRPVTCGLRLRRGDDPKEIHTHTPTTTTVTTGV
jgi:hypothetical protein